MKPFRPRCAWTEGPDQCNALHLPLILLGTLGCNLAGKGTTSTCTMTRPEHPNEPGKWTFLDSRGDRVLWKRERSDPVPVTVFYVIDLPRQPLVLYDEATARNHLGAMEAATSPAGQQCPLS